MHKVIIIGGGVAGLAAANRLTELGICPLVIEGGSYPCHKVCGEFFSPGCVSQLHHWNVHPIPLKKATLRSPSNIFNFAFPTPAGSLSHLQADPLLAFYATQHGAEIMTHTRVKSFHPKQANLDVHSIELTNGEWLEAQTVIIATGRIPSHQTEQPQKRFMGIKAHFANIPLENSLELFFLPGAYVGITPIEQHHCNVACLTSIENMSDLPETFMDRVMEKHPLLEKYLGEGQLLFNWMTAPLPEFGLKTTPDWKDVLFIGDAAGTIPPATGNGLSLAISGGCLAAEYIAHGRSALFQKEWKKRCASQIFWGKIMHKLLTSQFSDSIMTLAATWPKLGESMYKLTR